jgi:hypothetical protein
LNFFFTHPWWTGIGGFATILGVLIALGAWQLPRQPQATGGSGTQSLQGGSPQPSVSPAQVHMTQLSPTSSATGSESPRIGSSDGLQDPLYLADVPHDQFVTTSNDVQRSGAKISGTEYPSSYWYQFFNCSSCISTDELNVNLGYRHFTGVVGLTDDSRHDDVIDGVQYFSIYANNKLVFGPQRVEYPAEVAFDIDMSGVSRIKLVVTDGTNDEYACWCGARLTS